MSRPTMRFVELKSLAQQESCRACTRARRLLIKQRTQSANQLRGLLAEEYGSDRAARVMSGAAPGGGGAKRRAAAGDAADGSAGGGRCGVVGSARKPAPGALTGASSPEACRSDERCRRLTATFPGSDRLQPPRRWPRWATRGSSPNARALGAFVGLVPSQHSSGGKTVLGGISKRGDRYLRTLLVHGARAALHRGAARRSAQPLGHRAQTKTRRQHGRGGAGQQARAHHLEAAQHRRGVRPPTPHHLPLRSVLQPRAQAGASEKSAGPRLALRLEHGHKSRGFFSPSCKRQ